MVDYIDISTLQGSIVRKKVNRSKCVHIDISFPNATESAALDAIIFQNYYCSSVSIAQQNSLQEFVTILENFVLMEDAHSEQKAQAWFTILSSQFNSNYVSGRLMRFSLFQPDTTWQRFEIQNIRAVSKVVRVESPVQRNVALTNCNVLHMIGDDWNILNEAAQAQKNLIDVPVINFTMAEYKKSIKKKEKKKDKKAAISQLAAAVANDDFGIAIPSFPKNSDLPDNV